MPACSCAAARQQPEVVSTRTRTYFGRAAELVRGCAHWGLYNGLDETLNEQIILSRRHPYELPVDLTIGDTVDFLSGAAYTASVAAVAFNGLPPIGSYII